MEAQYKHKEEEGESMGQQEAGTERQTRGGQEEKGDSQGEGG